MLVPGVLHQWFWFCTCHRSGPMIKVFSHTFMYALSRNRPKFNFAEMLFCSHPDFTGNEPVFVCCHPWETKMLRIAPLAATQTPQLLCFNPSHPLLLLGPPHTLSLPSSREGGVNYIIFLCSINYVNFCRNNIKYGNSPSRFLNPLHSLTSVTPTFERKQLQRRLGNVIMLICWH